MLRRNANNRYECAICHGEYDTVRTLSLHISLNHKRDTHDYYDEYCKDPGEGVCKVCGAPTRYRSFGDGYKPTCSHKCGSILLKNDPEKMAAKKAKTVATCMERYGVTNAGGTKESLEKAQQTHLAKHGVRWAMQSKEVVEKSKQTCLDRYGATTYVHSTEGTARVEATVAEKFGRTNFFSGAEGNKAARDGYMVKHGYDHNMHDPQFLEKWKTEHKAKYDGKFYVETDEFKDKSRATQIERYGTWHSASEYGKKNAIALYAAELLKHGCIMIGMNDKNDIRFRCSKCGTEHAENSNYIKFRVRHDITPCATCYCKSMPTSCEEQEVSKFIESLGLTVSHYDRGFLGQSGADIVVESEKVIVEYDGLFWHSEQHRPNDYHLNKTLTAEKMGYHLIHLFSDEWIYSYNIVRSRLATILNKSEAYGMQRVYARKCTIDNVPADMAREFLKNNHLQGNVDSPWRIGLYLNGALVSIMTFGNSRFGDGIEMHRFCTRNDMSVVGAAGKLFSHFVKTQPDVNLITSYADARWSTGHAFYEKLGFTLEAMSSPGYYIVDGDIRRNRMQFQRHKIAGPGDEGKTEHEITFERGLFRIYDCGQYRYVWKRGEQGG